MAYLVRSGLHNEDVLRFEVSVDDTLAVQETNPGIWGRESTHTILDYCMSKPGCETLAS